MRLCPVCGSDSRVVNTSTTGQAIRRRRRCMSCDERWTTYEIPSTTISALVEFAATAGSLAKISSRAAALSVELGQAAEDFDVPKYLNPDAVSVTGKRRARRNA